MRAIVFEEFGEPSQVLQLKELPKPEPGPGEVLVRMIASPINPSDLMTVRGIYGKRLPLPATPGYEGVGIVETSGGGFLANFFKGKRVAVPNRETGNWSEFTVIPARQAIPLSEKIPIEQAVMFFVNPATAYVLTRKIAKVPKGGWLLQTAAGSALGRMIIRLGKHYGFRTINIVRREDQVEELKALGADAVLVFDATKHEREMLHAQVQELTENQGVKYALDPVGGESGSAVIGCLGELGALIVFGTLADQPLSFSSRELMTKGRQVSSFWLSRWMQSQNLLGKLGLIRKITKLMLSGVLVSEVGEAFTLEEISQAVTQAERPGRSGKVVLTITEPST